MVDEKSYPRARAQDYPEVEKWLAGKKYSTKYSYLSALSIYAEFTGFNPTQIIDEAEADRKKSARERGVPEQRIKKFREWLLKKYQQRTRGRLDSPKKLGKIGISETLANVYCMSVKSFYKANGFPLDVKLGKARKKRVNFKLVIRSPEISKLLSVATSLRDKSIIKFAFETCQGVSEVCSPNYGDIKRYKEDGIEVWQFHVIRKKTKTEYYTEIGPETIELLKLYFAERERKGEKLNHLSPLFAKEGRKKRTHQRITSNLVENMMKTLAIKSGLVTEEQMKLADLNPARPHSLRAGGMSVLKLDGAPEKWVEFRSGHELNDTDQAYFLTRPEELRELFREHYNALRIKPIAQFDQKEVKKLRGMLAEKEITIGALQENGKLKVAELQRLREELDQQRTKIENLNETIEGLSDKLEERVLEVERQFNERLNDFFADYQAQMSDAEKEVELPPVSKEEILRAKETLRKVKEEKIPEKALKTDKPKKELSWHELIYGTEQGT